MTDLKEGAKALIDKSFGAGTWERLDGKSQKALVKKYGSRAADDFLAFAKMKVENQETRGGAREGAGRKTKDASGASVTVSFCCSPAQKKRLDADAASSGKSRSEYINSKLFI